jgi:hypothetical protein
MSKNLPAILGPRHVLVFVTREFVRIKLIAISNELRPVYDRPPLSAVLHDLVANRVGLSGESE